MQNGLLLSQELRYRVVYHSLYAWSDSASQILWKRDYFSPHHIEVLLLHEELFSDEQF
jgi:hypothetical protein